jgi:hypothetical protein
MAAAATVDEVTRARDAKHLATLDDATLVFAMLGLQGELPPSGEWGPNARYMRRMVFKEIADRWIPPEVVVGAWHLMEADDDA